MIERLVAFSVRHRRLVLAFYVLLTAVSVLVTVQRFSINTEVERLISEEETWRKNEIAFEKSFPNRSNLVVAVIDGKTPEQADEAATKLEKALSGHPDRIRSVDRPDSGPFFDREGLLLMPQADLERTTEQLLKQQGLLGPLAADPSLRGVMQVLTLGARGVQGGQAKIEDLAGPMDRIDETLQAVLADKPARLSWQLLLSNEKPSTRDLRRFLIIQPVLDYAALQPAHAVTELIRKTARDLKLTPGDGVTVRLTGQAAIADEEFGTLSEDALLNNSLTILAIAALLWMALKSGRLIAAVLATTFAGLAITAALGLLMVGQLNPISVAFAALFVGLGVDFCIQFAVRYRDERYREPELAGALRRAARGVGWSLTLAALSLLAGFFSFLPTAFRGVSELGLIAGAGMIVAYLASLTLLPALIAVLRPRGEPESVETHWLVAVDHWIVEHRKLVIAGTAAIVIGGIPFLLKLDFDSNPMNLRSDKVESVSTFLDLIKDPDTSPNTIDVLVRDPAAVDAMAAKLSALPEVARVASVKTFVPPDQDEKIETVRETAQILGPVLNPGQVSPKPSDAETVAAVRAASTALKGIAGTAQAAPNASARRLGETLDRLASAPADRRAAADTALTVDLTRLLERLRTLLAPETITVESLPASIRSDWVGRDGRARIEVHAKGNSNDNAVMAKFAGAVQAVAPDATGAPISTTASGKTITRAFLEAGVFALGAIFVILAIALRRPWDVALALGPLVLATIMTLEACYLIGLPLNFANIIAMPLMLAVGVAFHIYYVIAWRAGVADMLASSLTRAIFFSALVTGVAFGSLCLSSHPGTASMGQLLALSLFFTLLAAFIIVPAFLGPPPPESERDTRTAELHGLTATKAPQPVAEEAKSA